MNWKISSLVFLTSLLLVSCVAGQSGGGRVQLTFDTSEADQVLAILSLRSAGKPIDNAQWGKLFATEPYQRLKVREQEIAKRFKDSRTVLTDENFKEFVLSDALLARASRLQEALDQWRKADLTAAGEGVLQYLPQSAVIRANVFPVIKPRTNSFVWEPSTNPAIFLYLDPDISAAKFANTVAHELHHIGLASSQAEYQERIKPLPERAHSVAEWVAAFGEGLAMLAAAGSPDVDPHAASGNDERARWQHDLANFNTDLEAVEAFFLDILAGKFPSQEALQQKGSSFFGLQGPWYTVGYKMAVIVEKRYGRQVLIQTMQDPRRLLVLYNQAAEEQNAGSKDKLPLWPGEVLTSMQVK
jgi:hypothetical protein